MAFERDGQRGTGWIRIPAKARKDQPTRVVLWLHGARGNGLVHQQALEQIGLGKAEIVLCPNGSRRTGPGVYDHADGAAPILAALDELGATWKLGPVVVGGHSAGAFAAHAVLAAAGERIAGVVVCGGGPAHGVAIDELAKRLGKRAPALCIMHGERDHTVDVDRDDKLYEELLTAGWPALRYWHPPELDHGLVELPLKEAFDWVLALSNDKPHELLAFAQQAASGERPKDALVALERALALRAPAAQAEAIRKLAIARATALGKQWTAKLDDERTRGATLVRFYDARSGLHGIDEALSPFKTLTRLQAAQNAPAQEALREAKRLGLRETIETRARMAAVIVEFPAAYESVREANAWLKKHQGR